MANPAWTDPLDFEDEHEPDCCCDRCFEERVNGWIEDGGAAKLAQAAARADRATATFVRDTRVRPETLIEPMTE